MSLSLENIGRPRTMQLLLAANPETEQLTLRRLASSTMDQEILLYIAENSNTPSDVLEELSASESIEIQIAVARNKSTPKKILSLMSLEYSEDVRYSMAEDYNLPEEILSQLMEDENPYVAVRAETTVTRLKEEQSKKRETAQEFFDNELGKIDVLVAEDNVFVQSLMLRKLKESNRINIVATVSDGEAAIDATRRYKPDVILMDYRMPKIGGIEATERIKQEEPQVRIVMVTGCDSDKSIIQALNAGADGYYLKTNAFNQLTTCIEVVAQGGSWLDPAISTSILRQCFVKEEDSCLGDMNLDCRSDASLLDIDSLKETVKGLVNSRKTNEAIQLCHSVYDDVVKSFGKTSEQAIDVMTLAADLYFSNRDYANAEKYFLYILEARQDVLKRADRKTDCVINTLARMSEAVGNLQQAELYYTWSLRIRERNGDNLEIEDVRNKLLDVTLSETNA